DGYVLLLALLSIFIGGTLVLLSGILIICRRCCEADRRHSRASDDPEKTTTTYLDDSQPAQVCQRHGLGKPGRATGVPPSLTHPLSSSDITIKVEDPDCLSASSYRDVESERFLSSSSSTARRVSFNEAALFDQGKKTQEKGRRYTLTEGDFHHLKNARLTHLHLPPPALKIVTIHECESSENSLAMTPRLPPPKPGLAIFQVSPPLPRGDKGDTGSGVLQHPEGAAGSSTHSLLPPPPPPQFAAAVPRSGKVSGAGSASPGEPPQTPPQGPVLQFFTRLRRHASLDGASPYFKIKKWKLESTQRASSLDTRGSPKRRQFQRQRAASESMDQEDRDPHQTDIIQYIARTDDVAFHPAGGPFLPAPASPPPSLGRYFSGVTPGGAHRLEPGEGGAGSPGEVGVPEQPSAYHDIWSLRASLELSASSERSNDQDSVRSDGGDSVSSAGGAAPCPSSSLDEAEGPEEKLWGRPKLEESEPGTRKLLQMDSGYASIEAPSRGGEEGTPKDQTASEKRICFTSAGRKGTIFESFEGREPEEEQEMFPGREAPPRRDYSIDEKTDALFNAFVRHDPQFDESPLRGKHRSRTHLRKQWQHAKQYSDPGVRYPA
ncbi:CBARP protein, partial [Alcedo cyanopectus]|nr:CBARP protein [Ceyx cyanopectus]